MVVNNAYTALDNTALVELVERRVRNDTSEIDGVIVAGCYFYSDGIDSWSTWPFEFHPIRSNVALAEFDRLKQAWDKMAEAMMTELIFQAPETAAAKDAVDDICFVIDGVTYVRPGPAVGAPSAIYGERRPRLNVMGWDEVPKVGLTIPAIDRLDFPHFQKALPDEPALATWEAWTAYVEGARSESWPECPLVPVSISSRRWLAWRKAHGFERSLEALGHFANERFNAEFRLRLRDSRETSGPLPSLGKFVISLTEVIGRNELNDMSTIAVATCRPGREPEFEVIASKIRMGHRMSISVACAYAVALNLPAVYWKEDLTYAWT